MKKNNAVGNLGEIVNVQSSTRIFEKEYTVKGVPFYRSKEIIEKHKGEKISNPLYISEDRYRSIKSQGTVPKEGDILLTSVGTIGIPYIVKRFEKFYFKDGNLTWFNTFSNRLYNKYLYYWFVSKIGQEAINSVLIGTTQKAITIQALKNLKLTLPPLSEQKRIANILSSFDNKMEQLKKENKILEDIAENIFKEWFIKYNFPNKDGKPYKDNGGMMIDSELGPIPEGWRIGKLGEYFPVTTGKRNANHARENGEYMFFTCSQDNLLCDEYSFNNGALLLAGNGDFNIKWYKGKFDAYQRTYVLIPHNQEQLGYLFFLMKHYLSDIIIGNRGSVISFITKGMIEDFTVFIPNEKIEKQANKVFSSIIQQQAQNDTKINVLTKTKNTLIKDLIK